MLLSPAAEFVFVVFFVFFGVFLSEFVVIAVGSPSDLFSLSRPRPSNPFPACHFPSICASFCPPRPLFSLALRGTLDISCVGPTLTQSLPVFTLTQTFLESSNLVGTVTVGLLKAARCS